MTVTTAGGLGLEENRLIDETRYWPVELEPVKFALYICGGCGMQEKVEPSFRFTRVAHLCHTKDTARIVR